MLINRYSFDGYYNDKEVTSITVVLGTYVKYSLKSMYVPSKQHCKTLCLIRTWDIDDCIMYFRDRLDSGDKRFSRVWNKNLTTLLTMKKDLDV